jgi:hypothetical protein
MKIGQQVPSPGYNEISMECDLFVVFFFLILLLQAMGQSFRPIMIGTVEKLSNIQRRLFFRDQGSKLTFGDTQPQNFADSAQF